MSPVKGGGGEEAPNFVTSKLPLYSNPKFHTLPTTPNIHTTCSFYVLTSLYKKSSERLASGLVCFVPHSHNLLFDIKAQILFLSSLWKVWSGRAHHVEGDYSLKNFSAADKLSPGNRRRPNKLERGVSKRELRPGLAAWLAGRPALSHKVRRSLQNATGTFPVS